MTLPFMAQPDALPAKPTPQISRGQPPHQSRPGMLPIDDSQVRDGLVREAAARYGVPVNLAIAVSHVENWSGKPDARSSAGAIGIMQVMPGMHGSSAEQLVDPTHNADVGMRVLKHYFDRFGNWDAALRAYNGASNKKAAGDRYLALVKAKMQQLGANR